MLALDGQPPTPPAEVTITTLRASSPEGSEEGQVTHIDPEEIVRNYQREQTEKILQLNSAQTTEEDPIGEVPTSQKKEDQGADSIQTNTFQEKQTTPTVGKTHSQSDEKPTPVGEDGGEPKIRFKEDCSSDHTKVYQLRHHWKRVEKRRPQTNSWNVYITPPGAKTLRSRPELDTFLAENPQIPGDRDVITASLREFRSMVNATNTPTGKQGPGKMGKHGETPAAQKGNSPKPGPNPDDILDMHPGPQDIVFPCPKDLDLRAVLSGHHKKLSFEESLEHASVHEVQQARKSFRTGTAGDLLDFFHRNHDLHRSWAQPKWSEDLMNFQSGRFDILKKKQFPQYATDKLTPMAKQLFVNELEEEAARHVPYTTLRAWKIEIPRHSRDYRDYLRFIMVPQGRALHAQAVHDCPIDEAYQRQRKQRKKPAVDNPHSGGKSRRVEDNPLRGGGGESEVLRKDCSKASA